jgi:hypothetical protein
MSVVNDFGSSDDSGGKMPPFISNGSAAQGRRWSD